MIHCPIMIKFAIFGYPQNKIIKKEIKITLKHKSKKRNPSSILNTKRNSIESVTFSQLF